MTRYISNMKSINKRQETDSTKNRTKVEKKKHILRK